MIWSRKNGWQVFQYVNAVDILFSRKRRFASKKVIIVKIARMKLGKQFAGNI
jgi:hypothetical protein